MPAIATVADGDTVGLRVLAVNPLGPVQEYVVIPAGPPVRVRGLSLQTGLFEVAVAAGRALTTADVMTAALVHPLAPVTVRL